MITDPDWMVEHLQDDLALRMGLYTRGRISDINVAKLKQLSNQLNRPLNLPDGQVSREAVASLLDAYSFAATKSILNKARAFTEEHNMERRTYRLYIESMLH